MQLRRKGATGIAQRPLAACLLAVLFVLQAAPAAAGLFHRPSETKSCCHRKGPCCCKDAAKSGQPGEKSLAAATDCKKQCRLAAGFSFSGFLLLAGRNVAHHNAACGLKPVAAERPGSPFSSYLAFLYQRPPPFC